MPALLGGWVSLRDDSEVSTEAQKYVPLMPLPKTRLANSVPGVVLAFLSIAGFADASLPVALNRAAFVGIAVGIWLTIRGFRLGLTLKAGQVTVRGYLATRTIERTLIREVTDFPAIVWGEQEKRRHWTPVLAFASGTRAFASVREHNAQCIRVLVRWSHQP